MELVIEAWGQEKPHPVAIITTLTPIPVTVNDI
jgi:hypothetical protein